ncbi:hypothetical protein RYX36_036241 [Vicia faba]
MKSRKRGQSSPGASAQSKKKMKTTKIVALVKIQPEVKQIVEDAGPLKEQTPKPQIETNELSPQRGSDFEETFASVHDNLDQDDQKLNKIATRWRKRNPKWKKKKRSLLLKLIHQQHTKANLRGDKGVKNDPMIQDTSSNTSLSQEEIQKEESDRSFEATSETSQTAD